MCVCLSGGGSARPSPRKAFIRNDTAITESPCAQVPNETLNRAAIRVCVLRKSMQSSAEEDSARVRWIYGCISEEEAHVWDVHYRICSPILFLICPLKRASAECERG